MQLMIACASHSPLIYFPATESPALIEARAGMRAIQEQVSAFDPELVVIFGCDHYGGHQMHSMPAFCVGVEATALSDVGGTPGTLRVPKELAVAAVDALRSAGIDTAVSYNMTVDHGFSQALFELTGAVERYPVLPVFISCIQKPFVPFGRARAVGQALAHYLSGLNLDRVLILGTGGLSHNPSILFPTADDVSEEWRPYIINGHKQTAVPQQSWIDYQIEAHKEVAQLVAQVEEPLTILSIHEDWDQDVLQRLCEGTIADFDAWDPALIAEERGIGSLEILTWIAATQCYESMTNSRPSVVFHAGIREVAIGFGIIHGESKSLFSNPPSRL